MNKHLVKLEKEYMQLFEDFELNDAEKFLNVEFGYVDGTFQSDIRKGKNINEDQDVDRNIYRKNKKSVFPKEYPCIVLLSNEHTSDRLGKIHFMILDFVYKKDFNK